MLGIATGLLYGWVIDPLEYIDLTPDTLRPGYRSDYVLVVAEVYQAEQNAELAARRLAILGNRPSCVPNLKTNTAPRSPHPSPPQATSDGSGKEAVVK
jgi:hypothetical protein